MSNREVDSLPLLTAVAGADVYGAKTNTDYRLRVGEAYGLATLGADGKVTAGQVAPLTFASITSKPTTLAGYGIIDGGGSSSSSWGSITGTLSSQTDLQAALNGKQTLGSYAAAVHTHTMAQITDAGTWATKNQTVSTSAASGTPADGAVWLQYTA